MSPHDDEGLLALFPIDLVLVAVLGAFTIAVSTGTFVSVPGRVLFGILAILFAPGYALVSALFPEQHAEGSIFENIRAEATPADGEVTAVERLLLAVGLSVCLVPLLGLALNYTPQGIDSGTLLAVTGALTVSLAIVAAVRRQQALPWERFEPNITAFLSSTASEWRAIYARSSLTVFIVLGLVVAAGGIGVAVIDADRGEQFSALYLLSEDPVTGDTVADDYPEEIATGESEQLTVGITNNEGEEMSYTVVAQLQAIDSDGDIREVQTLDRFTATVQPGQQWEQSHTITPRLTGENRRVTYLLYTGDPPETGLYQPENAYRSTHIWIDVPERTQSDTPDQP